MQYYSQIILHVYYIEDMGNGNTKHHALNFQLHKSEKENKSKRKIFYLSSCEKDKEDTISPIKQAPGIKGKSKRIKWSSLK